MKLTNKQELIEKLVNTYGGIELDKDEKEFLSLGPDFAIFEPLKRQKAAKEFLMATTKIRWDIMGKPIEDIKYKRS